MPRVPSVEGPSVAPAGIPDAYQRAPAALGQAGQVRAGYAAGTAQVASQAAEVFQRAQEEMDQVRVDDAMNQLKERRDALTFTKDTGYTSQRGLAALQRQSGKPLADEYGEQLQQSASTLDGSLGNDRQKRLFRMKANDVVTGFRGQVLAHEGQQADAYVMSVREGTVANSQNEIGKYWNDPVRIDGALSSIDAAVADMGRKLGGKSAEWIEARQRAESSKALTSAVGAALEKHDYLAADALLKRYGERMTADDMVRARGVVDRQFDAGVAQQTASTVIRQVQPTIQPTDFDRVLGITLKSESGGQRYGADGKLLTSPKGAKGEMQVMDGTSRDPGFGVTPARDDSPAERARVGRDYLGAMVKKYSGNLGQAWAAYNAGPGAVDAAIEQSMSPDMAKRGKYGEWLGALPAETQAYVQKNMAAYQAGDGKPQAATLQDVHAAVRARIGEGNPQRLKLAIDESTRQFEEIQKAVKQRDDESVANAQRWLADNGGRWTMLPAGLRAAVPAGKVDDLLNFAERTARGEDRTNPAVYQQLSNQDFLRGLSEDQFYTLSTRELSQADRKHFAAERGRLLTGAGGEKPGDLNTGAVKSMLDTRLRELGIDPTPKDNGGADAARVGAIRQFVDRSILAAQASAGKKFTDADISKHVDGLFSQTDVVKGWFSDSSTPLLTMQTSDIPSAIRTRLKADFKAAGVDDPTDGQLLGAFFVAKNAQKARRITPIPAGAK